MLKLLAMQWLLIAAWLGWNFWFLLPSAEATIVPKSPCPEIFRYEKESFWPLVGRVTGIVVFDGIRPNLNNTVHLTLSLPAIFTTTIGSLQLLNLGDLPQKPARFRVNFPSAISVPDVVSITFNGRVVCKGSPVKGPWASTIDLSYYLIVPSRKQTNFPSRVDSFEDLSTLQTTKEPLHHQLYDEFDHDEVFQDRRTTQRPSKSLQFPDNHSYDGDCGQPASPVLPLLMGGMKIRRSDWPWLSVLFYKNRDLGSVEFRCGASLISDRALLTAAHCLLKFDGTHLQPSDILVSLGRYNIMEWGEPMAKTASPRALAIHPQFSSATMDYDIAVVTLSEPITFTTYIRPVCLWSEPIGESLIVGLQGTVVGWGFSSVGALSEVPKQAQLKIVSEVDCIRSDVGLQLTTSERTLCAGGDGTGPCQGDSGGGLYLLRGSGKGRWVLRGIVSHSLLDPNTGKCDTRKYSVFTDVAKFRDWLREQSVYEE